MHTLRHVRLILTSPRGGWLPVRFELDDFVVEAEASNVMNDPLDEWLGLASYCIRPVGERSWVYLWQEPDGYAIDVIGASDSDTVTIRVYRDEFLMSDKSMTLLLEAELDRHLLSAALVQGLRDLLQDGTSARLDDWSTPRWGRAYAQRLDEIARHLS